MKRFISFLLIVVFIIATLSVSSFAYIEQSTKSEYAISQLIYIVDNKAFYLDNEILSELNEKGESTLYLPKNINLDTFKCFFMINAGALDYLAKEHGSKNSEGGFSSTDDEWTIKNNLILDRYFRFADGYTITYKLIVKFVDNIDFNYQCQIGYSQKGFKLFAYCIDGIRTIYLDQNEIDTLNQKRVLYLTDDNIKNDSWVTSCIYEAEGIRASSATAEIPKDLYLDFEFDTDQDWDYDDYVIHVNYHSEFYRFIKRVLPFVIDIIDRILTFFQKF